MVQRNSFRLGAVRLACGPAWICLALLLAGSGCHLAYPGRHPQGPKPYIPPGVPREQDKVTFPDYIIEPPDILQIEVVSLVPKQPYGLKVYDTISLFTEGLPEDEDIAGDYTIQPNGTIQIGRKYGAIVAQGQTTEALQESILAKLKEDYTQPKVWITLQQLSAQQQIAGEHLVGQDGKINFGSYGRVRVVGMTMEEATQAIQAHLSQYLENPEISLDVLGYNSKVYYVITQGAGLGDQVNILPARGNETVLDAIGQIQGLQSNSSTRMWIARPGTNEIGGDQVLPVDWLAVTQRGDTTTNYQIFPGDRIYVSEDKAVAFDTALSKLISPVERLFSVTLLGTQVGQRVAFFRQSAVGNQGVVR